MLDKLLAKGSSLVGVLHRLFVADAREAQALDDDTDTFVARAVVSISLVFVGRFRNSLEVCHQDLETLVFLADQVLYRYLDIFEGDICCATRPDTLAVHLSG